jgi:hypothetical protein
MTNDSSRIRTRFLIPPLARSAVAELGFILSMTLIQHSSPESGG